MLLLGGIIVIATALYIVGRGLVAAMGRFRSGVGVAWRYGLANVARRGRVVKPLEAQMPSASSW